MIKIGKVGEDIIYLVERNQKDPMRSTVRVGKETKGRPILLASLSRFRPYDEIVLDDDIDWT